MDVGEICNRVVVYAERDMPLTEAARLMREHHVGSLVVVDEGGAGRVPVGMITDRDIVIAVVGEEVEPGELRVGEVMGGALYAVRETDSMLDALKAMRHHGVRRLPVLTAAGTLAGIVTLDDALEVLAEQLNDLASVVARERQREAGTRA